MPLLDALPIARRYSSCLLFLVLLGNLLSGWGARAAEETSILTSSGDWTEDAIWSSTLYPNNGNGGLTYDVSISSGTVNLAESEIEIESLLFGGGTISGEGTLTLNESSQWTSGTLAGPMEDGVLTLAGDGPLVIGGSSKAFSGEVVNSGTWVWQSGTIRSDAEGSTITNTGLIDLQGDGTSFALYWNGSVINAAGGTLRRSVGTGTATISLPVHNQGTIEVQSGTLALSAGGSSSGHFDVSAGATLSLSGDFTLEEGATGSGEGVVYNTGTLNVNGAAQLAGFHLASGSVTGAGTLTLTEASQWTAGTLASPSDGVLTLAGDGPLVISGSSKAFSGEVVNSGTWVWQSGTIYSYADNSTITNSGLIDLQGDGTSFALNWTGSVINAAGGTLRRSAGTGTATISLPVHSQGIIEVESGTLSFSAGGSSSGHFDVSAGATLALSGDFTLEEGATGSGEGVVYNTGTLNVNGAAQLASFHLASGSVTGASTLTLTEASQWTAGTLAGPMEDGVLTLAGDGPLVISGSSKAFSGEVANSGNWVWESGPIYSYADNSTITNSGLIDLQGDGTSFALNWTGSVINAADGTLRRSAGTGTATISLPVHNQGTIEVQSGTLALSAGGSSSGHFDVSAGATLSLSGDFTLEEGATGSGEGVVYNTGTLNVNGAAQLASFHLASGSVTGAGTLTLTEASQWTAGTLAGPMEDGVLTLAGDGPLVISGSSKAFSGEVANSGNWVWQSGTIYSYADNSTITNSGLIDLQGDGTSFAPNWNGSVANAAGGTLRRSVGAGTATISLPVYNQGTIEVQVGSLSLIGGLDNTGGTIDVASGALLYLSQPLSQTAGGSITGNGTIVGNIENHGFVSPGNSPGSLTVQGNYTQGSSANLLIEIAGLTPIIEYDQLLVSNNIEIGGTLTLRFLDGFAPSQGDEFSILMAGGSFSGDWLDVQIENLMPGFDYTLAFAGGTYTLTALNDGEFVPEPASVTLALLTVLAGLRWRGRLAMRGE